MPSPVQTLESLHVGVTRRALATAAATLLVLAACTSDGKPAASTSLAPASSAAAILPIRVLVSNDDGVAAPGIDALVQALVAEPATQVTVVAPATNQSGTGGKTSPGPLTATMTTTASGYPATSVEGYPSDAVVYALASVLKSPPDLVVSGANAGQNLGPFLDVSGTVGVARAAAQQGIPALAVSAGFGNPIDFSGAVAAAISWLHDHRDALVTAHEQPTSVANLNVPTCASGAVRGQVSVVADPAGPRDVAVAPADCTSTAPAAATDVPAFHDGFATLSDVPLGPAS
jgi:5'-nucleotidase